MSSRLDQIISVHYPPIAWWGGGRELKIKRNILSLVHSPQNARRRSQAQEIDQSRSNVSRLIDYDRSISCVFATCVLRSAGYVEGTSIEHRIEETIEEEKFKSTSYDDTDVS